MSRLEQQRNLFSGAGTSWCSLSAEQQDRIVDLLSELLVDYLERREPAAPHTSSQRKEDHDA